MIPDPPVRKDGLCACGCGKRLRRPARFLADRLLYESDPFATTDCCRAWHGCPRREYSRPESAAARAESGRASAERYREARRMETW